ncbi:hypothetical protein [Pseudomonas putida]|uniref:hypothetical protein n=1 Tax=Pseudomonas putida TaxID=303 RepID=UPI0012601424|nr:hypothetical protein [Pseudomonas putida]
MATKSTVLIDNCAWDELMRRGVDLREEQATDLEFNISLNGSLEIPSEDHERSEARATGNYIREQMKAVDMKPAQWLVLGDLGSDCNQCAGLGDMMPDGNVVGGGYMTSVEGRDFANDDTKHKKVGGESGTKRQGSGLLKNQTDVDYGEWSMEITVVTLNTKDFRHAGKIIDLSEWNDGSFGDFIRSKLANQQSQLT